MRKVKDPPGFDLGPFPRLWNFGRREGSHVDRGTIIANHESPGKSSCDMNLLSRLRNQVLLGLDDSKIR